MKRTTLAKPVKGSVWVNGLALGLALLVGCRWSEQTAGWQRGSAPATGSAADASCARDLDAAWPPTAAGTDAQPGTERTFPPVSVMTWNLDWFQDPTEGPADDAAQYAAVREILWDTHRTVIALEELSSEAAFEHLLSDLPGYAGVLSGYAWTQKTALLWRSADFELSLCRAVSGLDDAGRPPLAVWLRRKADGLPLRFIVIHAKAQADAQSHAHRARFAQGLKAYLDASRAQAPFVLLGDFNDRLEGSITSGAVSPYQAFVRDPSYAEPTLPLEAPGAPEASYASGTTLDHILVRADLAADVVAGSVDVLREELQTRYPNFSHRVSDHFPVTLDLAL